MGLLHAAGPPSLPAGDRDSLLGEVLRNLAAGRLVGLHSAGTGADNFPRVRDTFLPESGRTQVRGDGVRHTGTRVTQGADRDHGHGG